jgi:DNA processing protein
MPDNESLNNSCDIRKNMLDNESLNKSCDIFPFANSEHSFSARPECVEDVYRRVHPAKCLAIVGSRKANAYGQNSINAIVPDLVIAGYTIVSGGAIGIDTMAHEAAVHCGGKTIAVLGSGLLRPYPSRNISLFKSIVENGGAVVSSFPLTMESLPGNFPARNRIVTGLARGCLVVQAAHKSGALISANYAMEQGREVFAIPGHIGDELSAGCNQIIQEGAKLVTCSADILQEFGDRIVQIDRQVIEQKAQQLHIDSVSSAYSELVEGSEHEEMVHYSAAQKDIVRACKKPISLEDIVATTQLDFAIVQSELFNLQLDGVIELDFTGMWVATK